MTEVVGFIYVGFIEKIVILKCIKIKSFAQYKTMLREFLKITRLRENIHKCHI